MEAAVPVVSGLGTAFGKGTPATGLVSAGNPKPAFPRAPFSPIPRDSFRRHSQDPSLRLRLVWSPRELLFLVASALLKGLSSCH